MDCECRLDGVVNFKVEIRKCAWRKSVIHRNMETENMNLRGCYGRFVSWRYNRNFRNNELFNLIIFFPLSFLSFYLAPLLSCVTAFVRPILRSLSTWFSYLWDKTVSFRGIIILSVIKSVGFQWGIALFNIYSEYNLFAPLINLVYKIHSVKFTWPQKRAVKTTALPIMQMLGLHV